MASKTMNVKESSAARAAEAADVRALSAYGRARSTVTGTPLSADELRKTRRLLASLQLSGAGHDLSAGQSAAARAAQARAHQEPPAGPLGRKSRTGFTYIHLNRLIKKYDLDMIFLAGPGTARRAFWRRSIWRAPTPRSIRTRARTSEGLREFFKEFSFPGGIGSHCTPETPGSIHEGGELGYVLSHACGAAFDNPDLIVAAVVGDGEAETGPLATSWHINKFLNPIRDGAVLPILHLNGYKINNPTLLARISSRGAGEPVRGLRLDALLRRRVRSREHAPGDGGDRWSTVCQEIRAHQQEARSERHGQRGRAGP